MLVGIGDDISEWWELACKNYKGSGDGGMRSQENMIDGGNNDKFTGKEEMSRWIG